MRHAARVSLAALLALSSTVAVAGPDMSRQVSAGVQRGAERFDGIYREGGIAAASDAVRACYKSLKRSAAGKLAECAALDIVSASVDQQAVHSLGVPPYAFFSGTGPEGRILAGIKTVGLSAKEKATFDRALESTLASAAAEFMAE
ncbi:hypothetical protein [Aureimonas leprariae]|uniref:Uncharacterized protein n=1 Tax=Plantimonas leprariae TaxID=2615207 RepID=A0A7V7PPA2_9HYPH|nr:hypothetical protein [Aureimonas leprariae]KAB0679677.1 hypothetical protein F6X38_12730 [Aureimonas leprariae]